MINPWTPDPATELPAAASAPAAAPAPGPEADCPWAWDTPAGTEGEEVCAPAAPAECVCPGLCATAGGVAGASCCCCVEADRVSFWSTTAWCCPHVQAITSRHGGRLAASTTSEWYLQRARQDGERVRGTAVCVVLLDSERDSYRISIYWYLKHECQSLPISRRTC